MQGDFSRLTFDPHNHYRGIYMQQGRVQLDADWNEQAALFNYLLETHIHALLGPSAAPQSNAGFAITLPDDQQEQKQQSNLDVQISAGHYYVDGMLCENDSACHFTTQPDYPESTIPDNLKHYVLIYLDVWQRSLSAVEAPTLYEVALGGIDTTLRLQHTWQVKLLPLGNHHSLADTHHLHYEQIMALPEWQTLLQQQERKTQLRARLVDLGMTLDNQLYRVEIHAVQKQNVTFKWSRENASVVFAVVSLKQNGSADEEGHILLSATLDSLGRDVQQLQKGDWVELVDRAASLQGRTLPLLQVAHAPELAQHQVTLFGTTTPALDALLKQPSQPLLLRRWDYDATQAPPSDGTYPVQEESWQALENGIQVSFQPGGHYQVGDYWLIPARNLGNTLEWPMHEQEPLALPPHGTYHHYCPLALLHQYRGQWRVTKDLRMLFTSLPPLTARTRHLRPIEETIVENIENVQSNTLSELWRSDEELATGDVIVLVPGTERKVEKASREHAKLVFGVVAEAIEINGEQIYRIVTYGRTQCKVVGSVEAGDLLTVAEEHGHAAKTGSLRELFVPGSLLGKALATYTPDEDNTVSMVEVMVTLQ